MYSAPFVSQIIVISEFSSATSSQNPWADRITLLIASAPSPLDPDLAPLEDVYGSYLHYLPMLRSAPRVVAFDVAVAFTFAFAVAFVLDFAVAFALDFALGLAGFCCFCFCCCVCFRCCVLLLLLLLLLLLRGLLLSAF